MQLQGTTSHHAKVNKLGAHNAVSGMDPTSDMAKLPTQLEEEHHLSTQAATLPIQLKADLYKVLPPPLDMSEAAAAPAVGTIPVECPGFDRCSSLQYCVRIIRRRHAFDSSVYLLRLESWNSSNGILTVRDIHRMQ